MSSEILYYFCLMHSPHGEAEPPLMNEHDCNYWFARLDASQWCDGTQAVKAIGHLPACDYQYGLFLAGLM